jgi:hypothetical protein
MIYSIDFETRSFADLTEVGLDKYANCLSTEVLCIAFGTQPDNVSVNKPIKYNSGSRSGFSDTDCQKLLDHVANGGKIQAWNAMFEYAIWNCVCVPKYGWPPLKLEQCIDSMAIAAANNVPQSLGDASIFMDSAHQKDTRGRYLIQKLCKPHKGGFNNDPELMREMFDYCAQDVRTEMAIVANLRPLSELEQEVESVRLAVQHEVNETTLDRLSRMSAKLMVLRKRVLPARRVLEELVSRKTALISDATLEFFGTMIGTLDRLLADIDSNREILESAVNLSLTFTAHRTNMTMNRMAVVSTIFLPLTFLCGVYGMNFEVLPEVRWTHGYAYFWVLSAIITGALVVLLRRVRLL